MPGSCHLTGYLNRFGTAEVTKQGPNDSISEDEGGCEDESGVSDPQLNRPTSSAQASGSSFPSSASDEEDFFRVGKTNRSKHHPLRSGHGPLTLIEV